MYISQGKDKPSIGYPQQAEFSRWAREKGAEKQCPHFSHRKKVTAEMIFFRWHCYPALDRAAARRILGFPFRAFGAATGAAKRWEK